MTNTDLEFMKETIEALARIEVKLDEIKRKQTNG
jgi:hypothetical protein